MFSTNDNRVVSSNVKALVASFSPEPTRPPSSIIQTAKAKGVRYAAMLCGTCLTSLVYQSAWIGLKLVYVKEWNRMIFRIFPPISNRVWIVGTIALQYPNNDNCLCSHNRYYI